MQLQTNLDYREDIKIMRSSPEEGFGKLEELGAIREVHIFDRSQRWRTCTVSSELSDKRLSWCAPTQVDSTPVFHRWRVCRTLQSFHGAPSVCWSGGRHCEVHSAVCDH